MISRRDLKPPRTNALVLLLAGLLAACPGSKSTTIAPSGLTYSAPVAVYPKGVAIAPNAPALKGGVAASYAIDPALPAGLTLDAVTGVISGAHIAVTVTTVFVVTATNAGGSATAGLSITVTDKPVLSFEGATGIVGAVGAPMRVAPTTLTSNGSPITACQTSSTSPALPEGFAIDPVTCVITGTPAMAATVSLVVVATNAAGPSAGAPFTLTFVTATTSLSYAGATGTTGFVGAPLSVAPTQLETSGAAVTSCTSAPALPAGLALASSTCVISGTPTVRAPAATYTITVTTAAGTGTAAVTLTVLNPATLVLSDDPSFDFGSWALNATATHNFTLTNSGDVPATSMDGSAAIGAGFTETGGGFPGFGGTCTDMLPPGSGCLIVVSFTPTQATTYSGTVKVSYNDGVQTQAVTRSISGTGTNLASLSITDYPPLYYSSYGLPADPATFDFGSIGVGTPVDHTFSVTNNGGGAATITGGSALAAPYSWKDGTFPGTGGSCGGTLGAGDSCTVVVTFTAVAGTSPSSFTVSDSGGVTTSVSRNITGTGTTSAVLSIFDIDDLDFGPQWSFGTVGVGQTSDHTFTVINSGGATATGVGPGTLAAPFSFPGGFPGGTPGTQVPDSEGGFGYCSDAIPPGEACAITVRFSPLSPGVSAASVDIIYDTTGTASRAVSGVGTATALLSILEASNRQGLVFDYGTRATGSVTSQTFLVSNLGAAPATSLTAGALASGFAWTGGTFPGGSGTTTDSNGDAVSFCASGGAVAPGAACAVSVDFSSAVGGVFQGTVGVTYAGGAMTTVTATRSLQGTATDLGVITVRSCTNCGSGSDTSESFGVVPVLSTQSRMLFVSNGGGRSVTLSDGGIQGTGFAYASGAYPGGAGTTTTNGTAYPFCGPAPYALAANATCVIALTYTAGAAAGSAAGNLTLNTASATTTSISLALGATVTSLAIVSLSDSPYGGSGGGGTPTHDFGDVAVGATSTVAFFVRNNGASAAILSDGGVTGTGFAYAGSGYPGGAPGGAVNVFGQQTVFCPASGGSLAPGSSCVLSVQYQATGSAAQTGTLTINLGNATVSTLTYKLAGQPTSDAIISVSDCVGCGGGGSGVRTHDYGTVADGSTSTAYFVVSNTGNVAATLTDGGITGAPFRYTSGSFPGAVANSTVSWDGQMWSFCGASGGTLAAGATCLLSLSYAPSGSTTQTGSFTLGLGGATVSAITWDLRGEPTSLAIVWIATCDGCGPLSPQSPPYDFGTVAAGSTNTTYVYLQNDGAAAATLSDGGITGGAFSYAGGSYPGGVPGTTLQTNHGSVTLCPASGGQLGAGQRCALAISYTASGTARQTGSLTVTVGGATVASLDAAFQGEPTALAIVSIGACSDCGWGDAETPTFDFGSIASGTTVSNVFYLRNLGISPATLTDMGVTGTGFSWSGGTYPGGTPGAPFTTNEGTFAFCPASGGTLAAGDTCIVSVSEAASGSSQQTGSLSIGLGGATTDNLRYDLQGEPTTQAIVIVTECATCGPPGGAATPLHDFGTVAAGASETATLYVRNTGSGNATLTNLGITGSAFSYAGGSYPGGAPGAQSNAPGSYDYCPTSGGTLPGGGTCVLSLVYAASGSTTQTGSLSLGLGGATRTSLLYDFQGEPTNAAIVSMSNNPSGGQPCCANPPVDALGSVAAGSVNTIPFFLSNHGNSAATLTDGGLTGSAFSYAGAAFPGGTPGASVSLFGATYQLCPASGGTLGPNATCVVEVTYVASGSTLQSGTITVNLSGATASSLVWGMSGDPTNLAIVSVSGCLTCGGGNSNGTVTQDFGLISAGTTVSYLLYVINTGSSAAKLTDGGITGAAFGYTGGTYPGGAAGTVAVAGSNPVDFCPVSGGSLAGGEACAIQLSYTASGDGAQSGTWTLDLGGATQTSASAMLTGTSSTKAIVGIADCRGCWLANPDGPAFDYGTAGTTLDRLLVVSNDGVAPADLTDAGTLAAPFSWTTGGYPGGTGSTAALGTPALPFCGATLAAQSSCVLSVRYSGTVTGTGSVTLNLTGAVSSSVSRALQGTATRRALLTVSEVPGFFGCPDSQCGPAGFGDVAVAGNETRTFLVSNRGGAATTALAEGTTLAAPFGFGSMGQGSFPGGTGTDGFDGATYDYCSAVLNPGSQCIVLINFSPVTSGVFTGAVNLQYADAMGAIAPNANRNVVGTAP